MDLVIRGVRPRTHSLGHPFLFPLYSLTQLFGVISSLDFLLGIPYILVSLLLLASSLRAARTTSNRLVRTFRMANQLVLDKFCLRQFNNVDYTGTQITYDTVAFENKVNEYYRNGYTLKVHTTLANYSDTIFLLLQANLTSLLIHRMVMHLFVNIYSFLILLQ